jgi:D-alanine-D-alanine ligase
LVHSSGLHTPRFHVVRTPADLDHLRLDYPLFAKPIAEGTGKGIDEASRVATPDELAAVCRRLLDTFDQPVLVEEFLPGREFTVGILGTGHDARVLGTLEVQILEKARSTVYSFTVKEQCEQLVRYSRPVPSPLTRAVEALALDAYRVLEVRDAGRADIRMDRDGQPAFMEINPLPGLHPTHSDLPMIATQAGMSYAELIGAIVSSAWARKGRP